MRAVCALRSAGLHCMQLGLHSACFLSIHRTAPSWPTAWCCSWNPRYALLGIAASLCGIESQPALAQCATTAHAHALSLAWPTAGRGPPRGPPPMSARQQLGTARKPPGSARGMQPGSSRMPPGRGPAPAGAPRGSPPRGPPGGLSARGPRGPGGPAMSARGGDPRGPPRGVPPRGAAGSVNARGAPPSGPPMRMAGGGRPPMSARGGAVQGSGAGKKSGALKVTVVSCKGLPEPGEGSAKDPYVQLAIGQEVYTSQIAVNGRTAPTFSETFSFKISAQTTARELIVQVYFKQAAGTDILCAKTTTPFMAWVAKGGFAGELPLDGADGQPTRAAITLKAAFEKPTVAAAAAADLQQQATAGAVPGPGTVTRDPGGRFTDDEIKEAFEAFDLDNNSFVGAAEIRHILVNIGENATDEEIDEMVSMIDKDGDGQVAFDEFYAMVTGGRPAPALRKVPAPGSAPLSARGGQRSARGTAAPRAGLLQGGAAAAPRMQDRQQKRSALDEFVKRHSLRQDGLKAAFKRHMEGESAESGLATYAVFCETMQVDPNAASEKLFKLFDRDGSGKIDMQEFIVAVANFTNASKDEKLQFAFAALDTANSGSISRDDLCRILMANHLASSSEEVQRKASTIMEQGDKDGNGVITYDEFVKVANKFPSIVFPATRLTS